MLLVLLVADMDVGSGPQTKCSASKPQAVTRFPKVNLGRHRGNLRIRLRAFQQSTNASGIYDGVVIQNQDILIATFECQAHALVVACTKANVSRVAP